jgi:hypothetical protein
MPQLILESKETLRNDGFRRRTSGFRYWLLVPFASVFIYIGIAWFSFIGMSAMAEKLRAKLHTWTAR